MGQKVTAVINADKAKSILFMTTKVLDASRTDELREGAGSKPITIREIETQCFDDEAIREIKLR